jgi:signal peptidase I
MTEAESPRVPWWQIVTVGRNPRVTLIRLLVLAGLTFFTFRYLCLPVRVTGISMSPTYRDGQRKFVNRVAFWFRDPERGDVVAVRTTGLSILYMKRVIGLPGERVRIVRGRVMIDGEEFEEPYLLNRAPWNWPRDGSERTLAPDEYLLIGDNRGMSQDSHDFGIAKRNKIIGRVIR